MVKTVGRKVSAITSMTTAKEIKQYRLSSWVLETKQTGLTRKHDIPSMPPTSSTEKKTAQVKDHRHLKNKAWSLAKNQSHRLRETAKKSREEI